MRTKASDCITNALEKQATRPEQSEANTRPHGTDAETHRAITRCIAKGRRNMSWTMCARTWEEGSCARPLGPEKPALCILTIRGYRDDTGKAIVYKDATCLLTAVPSSPPAHRSSSSNGSWFSNNLAITSLNKGCLTSLLMVSFKSQRLG